MSGTFWDFPRRLCHVSPSRQGFACVSPRNTGYRSGEVYHLDAATGTYRDGNPSWAKQWEKLSDERGQPKHVSGWEADDTGSRLKPPDYQRLAGPWIDGRDPAV